MNKLIAILTAACFALATGANAAKPPDQGDAKADKKSAPKSKAVAPKPQAAPKQRVAPPQQQSIPKTNVESKAPKKERTVPAVQTETDNVKNVESKKVKPDKAPKLQTDKAPDKTNVVADDKLRKDAKPTAKIQKLEPAAVKKIQAQHTNFKATPKTAINTVQFNPNYRIAAAQNWTGPQYEVFRSYQPQWHDRSWWSSRYTTISLIAGGWYFWDAGYWYPAWGYDDIRMTAQSTSGQTPARTIRSWPTSRLCSRNRAITPAKSMASSAHSRATPSPPINKPPASRPPPPSTNRLWNPSA